MEDFDGFNTRLPPAEALTIVRDLAMVIALVEAAIMKSTALMGKPRDMEGIMDTETLE